MRNVIYFYMQGCPYCRQANRAIEELTAENPKYAAVPIQRVDENQHPELVKNYSYYYVPTMIVGNDKVYEARPGESYAECREQVQKVLDAALAE